MNTAERQRLEEERDFLLGAIEQLDREHGSGELSEEEYRALRDQQTARAADVLRSLERPAAPETVASETSRSPRNRRWMWMLGVGAFVLVAGLLAINATTDRLSGDTSTGSSVADSNTLLRRAQELTAKGQALDAVKAYDRVLAVDPNNAQALTYRGWLVRLAGLSDEGLTSIDRAIAVRPAYPDAHFFRGFILLRDKADPKAAIPEFETFLANSPPPDMVPLVQQALDDARTQAAK